MIDSRRLTLCCALAACISGICASAAPAATFYVNERNGADEPSCGVFPGVHAGGEGPCLTIGKAVKRAESFPAPNAIEIAEGEYVESLKLEGSKAAGLTINGEEPGVIIRGKTPAVLVHLAGAVTLSNLTVKSTEVGATLVKSTLLDSVAALTLNNVNVENESSSGKDGLEATEGATITMNGGHINMENGVSGYGAYSLESTLSLSGVTILSGAASADEAGGVSVRKSSLVMTNTKVAVEGAAGPNESIAFAIAAGNNSSVTLQNDVARQNAGALGVVLETPSAVVNGLRVEMVKPTNNLAAVDAETETGGSWIFSHLEVGGTWVGDGMFIAGAEATVTDSRITQSPLSELPAVKFAGRGAGSGLLVQRSALQGAPKDSPGALTVVGGNATTDSSEILGGKDGVYFEDTEGAPRTLTLSASTIDAGAPGIAADAPGVNGVEALAKNKPGGAINATIQGSIVLEKQTATAAAGDAASVSCTYSAAPSQVQTAGGGSGAIACAAGSGGNSEVNPLSSPFVEPLTAYTPLPTSSAIGTVPAGALTLPFGVPPSSTDFAGNARTGDGVDACFTAQDKGALELQGHLVSCASPPVASPAAAPTVTDLAQSHSKWREGDKAAQISRRRKKKLPIGTTFSFHLNEVATVSFTFSRRVPGRKVRHKCVARTHKNAKRKSCRRIATAGSFSFTSHAGLNKVFFQGRVPGGAKLKPGRYTLTILARNAARQSSAPKALAFTIVK